MGRLKQYLDVIQQSRLLAPNLREMTLRMHTGNKNPANAVARVVVRDHLLALRWMNPNATIYLREVKGQGAASVEYFLCAYRKVAVPCPPAPFPLTPPAHNSPPPLPHSPSPLPQGRAPMTSARSRSRRT
jgi:hypothetical protein